MKTILNAKNIEDIVFKNNELKSKLKKYAHIFSNWHMASTHPTLRYIKNESVYSLLKLLDKKDLEIIKDTTGLDIDLDPNIYKSVVNITSSLNELEFELPADLNFIDLSVYRKQDELKVTLWK